MVLEDFRVMKYGSLTNAGDVLFAKNPSIRLPQTRVRAYRYVTDKAGDAFGDMKSFEGPLHSVLEDAYLFIIRNTPTIARFVEGTLTRQDLPLYPEKAVREALINAVAHRDYSNSGGGVAIHVYPRRLEIWNSGGLPKGVHVNNLAKGQISVLRNPDIAQVLYMRGLMEKLGRGSVLMIQECINHGLLPPTWSADPGKGVTVTFTSPNLPNLERRSDHDTDLNGILTTDDEALTTDDEALTTDDTADDGVLTTDDEALTTDDAVHDNDETMQDTMHDDESTMQDTMYDGESTVQDTMHDDESTMQDTMHDGESTMQDTMHDGESTMHDEQYIDKTIMILIPHLDSPKTRSELQKLLNLKNIDYFRKAYLRPALEMGVVEMTLPDQRQSKNQKYRLTAKGVDLLRKVTGNR